MKTTAREYLLHAILFMLGAALFWTVIVVDLVTTKGLLITAIKENAFLLLIASLATFVGILDLRRYMKMRKGNT